MVMNKTSTKEHPTQAPRPSGHGHPADPRCAHDRRARTAAGNRRVKKGPLETAAGEVAVRHRPARGRRWDRRPAGPGEPAGVPVVLLRGRRLRTKTVAPAGKAG